MRDRHSQKKYTTSTRPHDYLLHLCCFHAGVQSSEPLGTSKPPKMGLIFESSDVSLYIFWSQQAEKYIRDWYTDCIYVAFLRMGISNLMYQSQCHPNLDLALSEDKIFDLHYTMMWRQIEQPELPSVYYWWIPFNTNVAWFFNLTNFI